MIPKTVKNFIEIFSQLPSIGTRQATRIAFKLIHKGKFKINELSKAISELGFLNICPNCFFAFDREDSDSSLCPICRNPERNKRIIAIVEKETDLISIEQTHKFNGLYLIIGDMTKNGLLENYQRLRLSHLKEVLRKLDGGKADEIIIAISPNTYNDINSSLIAQEILPFTQKITQLGRGIPTGAEIEFADEETLGYAIDRRN